MREDIDLNDPSLAALQQRLKARKGEIDLEMQNMISEVIDESKREDLKGGSVLFAC